MEFDNIKDIKELIKTIDNSKIMDFELKLQDNVYIKMSKHKTKHIDSNINNNINPAVTVSNISGLELTEKIEKSESISENNVTNIGSENNNNIKIGEVVKSPIVGTFYSSNAPEKPNFVNIGDKVKKGDTLCIVEAMKVMNEINSPYDGEVIEILVNNEDMVEYNQELFRIK